MPTAGSIFIQGEDIGRKSHRAMRKLRAEKIGMVFRNFALLPHLNVIDNVALGLELRHRQPIDREKKPPEDVARAWVEANKAKVEGEWLKDVPHTQ